MPSAFVPIYTADQTTRQLQDRVQRATTSPAQRSALRTKSFTAAAGAVYRVRPTSTAGLAVALPAATPPTSGQTVTLLVDEPVGAVRVTCPTGQVDNADLVTLDAVCAVSFVSNGDGGWIQAGFSEAVLQELLGFGLTWDSTNREIDVDQTATFAWTGAHAFGGQLRMSTEHNTTLSAQADDLAIGNASSVNILLTGDQNISGMVSGSSPGRVVFLTNRDPSNTLTVLNNLTSTAANRFLCPNDVNYAIPPRSGAVCVWNASTARWHMLVG